MRPTPVPLAIRMSVQNFYDEWKRRELGDAMTAESIRDVGYAVSSFLVILAIPFSVGLGLLLLDGVAWWIAVPIALIAMPFVRGLLFGPPCVFRHRKVRPLNLSQQSTNQ